MTARRPSRRAAALGGLGTAAAAALGLAALGLAGPGEALPDLRAELPSADEAHLQVTADGRRLLRFDAALRNAGAGPLELAGTPAGGPGLAAEQRIYDGAGDAVVRTRPLPHDMVFEDGDGHHHWHVLHAASYSLWSAGPEPREVAPGAKVGFCLLDSRPEGSSGPAVYTHDCVPQPGSDGAVVTGISPTWGDLYSRWLAFQWVDVTGVAPGPYRLRAEADPDGQIEESDETDQVAWADVWVPGLVARDVALGEGPAGAPRAVELEAEAVNGPATPPEERAAVRFFQILGPPAHGTLSDVNVTDPHLVYVPDPGYAGPDRFTYRAYDNANGLASAPAAVTLTTAPAPPGAASAPAAPAGAPAPAAARRPAAVPRRPALTVRARWSGPGSHPRHGDGPRRRLGDAGRAGRRAARGVVRQARPGGPRRVVHAARGGAPRARPPGGRRHAQERALGPDPRSQRSGRPRRIRRSPAKPVGCPDAAGGLGRDFTVTRPGLCFRRGDSVCGEGHDRPARAWSPYGSCRRSASNSHWR